MAEYGRGERAYRARSTAEAPRDAVTSALTAQVMLCIILAVCMLLVKKFDNEEYTEIKRQYAVMLSDSSQTAELKEIFAGENSPLSGVFAWVDKFMSRLRPGNTLEEKPETRELPPENAEDEPEDVPTEADAQFKPDFDYLKGTSSLAYVASSGGMFPVDEEDTGAMLSPPEGSTLSPIYLSAGMKPPITGVITSGFSYRFHPLTGNSDFHTGLDIAAAEGTPILAALPGEVAEVGFSKIYGNYIVLKHSANLKTSYSHCSEILAREGIEVRQGERIALVGETGTTTGPHLHFSVIVEDEFADPSWVLSDYIQLVEE